MSTNFLWIEPVDARSDREPGETVELVAKWTLVARPAVLEARLFWRTSGKGTEDLAVVARQSVPAALATARGEHGFCFTLPQEPWSFSGKLISLQWAVELVADDESVRWEFTLAPGGREVRLHGGKT
jgi:hypothetical protein